MANANVQSFWSHIGKRSRIPWSVWSYKCPRCPLELDSIGRHGRHLCMATVSSPVFLYQAKVDLIDEAYHQKGGQIAYPLLYGVSCAASKLMGVQTSYVSLCNMWNWNSTIYMSCYLHALYCLEKGLFESMNYNDSNKNWLFLVNPKSSFLFSWLGPCIT